MNIYYRHIIPILAVLFAVACTNSKEENTTYFGGKIINPKSNFVVLSSKEGPIDTLELKPNKTFLGAFNDLPEGLYYFTHGNENQYVYFESQDSILVHLNTWDFDETLTFSGKGAEKNNLLIESFLAKESLYNNSYKFYYHSPENFKGYIDSLLTITNDKLSGVFSENLEMTDNVKHLLKVAYLYPLYSRLEYYPEAHKQEHKLSNYPKVEANFYNHRKNVDINIDSLFFFHAYRDYVINNLYNVAHSENQKNFTVSLLNTINDKISHNDNRNSLLRQTVIYHFYRNSNCTLNTKSFDTFFDLSTNDEDKLTVKKLYADAKVLAKTKSLPNFKVVDHNNSQHKIHDVAKGKNTMIYFWNPQYVSKEYLATKINYLQTKNPSVKFLGVKIDGKKDDYIKKLDIKNQFFINSSSGANKFLTSKLPRSILINKKGEIVDDFVSLSSNHIYKQIADLAKK